MYDCHAFFFPLAAKVHAFNRTVYEFCPVYVDYNSQRQRERERKRERERERETKTDRETETEAETETDRDRQTEILEKLTICQP